MIWWVASYPKSGNTWVRLFLIAYGAPDDFNFNMRPKNYVHDTAHDLYKSLSPVPLEDLTKDESRLLRGAVLVCLLRNAGAPCCVKTHCANVSVNGQLYIPPEITDKAIYVLRDPRDVVISYADHHGISLDEAIVYMADDRHYIYKDINIPQPLLSWSDHINSWLRPVPYDRLAVRYEELHKSPKKWFYEIIKFLGLEFDEKRFEQALKLTTFEYLQAQETEHGFVAIGGGQKKFFRSGRVGSWQEILTLDQIKQIEMVHGSAMRRAGYHLSQQTDAAA